MYLTHPSEWPDMYLELEMQYSEGHLEHCTEPEETSPSFGVFGEISGSMSCSNSSMLDLLFRVTNLSLTSVTVIDLTCLEPFCNPFFCSPL